MQLVSHVFQTLIFHSPFSLHTRLWKVFYDDKDRPNRYLLAKEMVSRPDAEELEVSQPIILSDGDMYIILT